MITRPHCVHGTVTQPTTTKWPPKAGEFYAGAWPPRFITPSGRCARTKPMV
jgi:hypothetical protein